MNLLTNTALKALTVTEEQIELVAIVAKNSMEARLQAAELRHRKIIFAFFQDDFQGGRIPYWHCVIPTSRSYRSTLSMQGLREWGVL